MKTCTKNKRDGKGNNASAEVWNEAIGRLLRRYEFSARKLALKLSGNQEEAKELVQEASVRALSHWDSFTSVKSFQAWYLRIVRNVFLDSRRRSSFRLGVPLSAALGSGEDGLTLIDVLADGEPQVPEQARRNEVVAAVKETLKTLSADKRAIVELCDFEAKGYEEAARELGVPSGTVRSRLSRTRAILRKQLSRWSE
ncbi:MAG: RNA polymerase sigma factor [Elusimicrobiota bacterium]